MNSGTIYVFSFENLPDVVKVGMTCRKITDRTRELSRLHGPAKLEYSVQVDEVQEFETSLLRAFRSWAHNTDNGREYFIMTPKRAIECITVWRLKRNDLHWWVNQYRFVLMTPIPNPPWKNQTLTA